ncbi:alpha-2-macroglobulin-like protein 1 isoform X2 [Ambystoma mexicanum]|uniref:alpha-2-macroglobulin-like protein 1 isoform X2 n=1 Tax=Ambystoma mexicanum TaxID=8296 RepID=UPI0037E99335
MDSVDFWLPAARMWALGWLTCALLLHSASASALTPHYAVLVPAEIHFGHTEQFCVDIDGLNETSHLEITLQQQESNLTLLAEDVQPPKLFKCAHFQVPLPAGGSQEVVQLKISLHGESHTLVNQKKLLLRTEKSGTFVQTDKAVYKPGQTVKCRIVTLNEDFMPEHKPYPLVELQDPNGNRIGQWLDVTPQHGIVDISIPLSSEPAQGPYKFKVGKDIEHQFTVEEYVPPKFEVVVELPKVVTIVQESFKMQMCAKYTYGKPVQGRYSATLCRKPFQYHWTWRSSGPPPALCMLMTGELERTGCFSKMVETEFFNMTETTYMMALEADASVTEDDTDVTLSGSGSCHISSDIATVVFEETDDYFKTGIPYTGRMKLSRADGTPMKDETIYLIVECSGQVENLTYVTDVSGRASFSLNTSNWDKSVSVRGSFKLQQPAMEYGKVLPRYQDAFLWLKPFYSKSKSFLKVRSLQGELSCGNTQDVQVDFIIQRSELQEDAEQIDLHYLVVSKGGIILVGTKELAVGKEEVLRGTCSISITIDAQLAPLAKVLVYTTFPDGEVTAGTATFKISKCFKNQVTLGFSKEEVLPGADVTLQVRSAPGAFCGLRAVDKSMVLMKPEEELTGQKVYDFVRPGSFGGYPYQAEDYEPSPCPGFPMVPEVWRPIAMSRRSASRGRRYYMPSWPQRDPDVYSLLQEMGIKMITDLNIRQPVKCREHPMYMHRLHLAPGVGIRGAGFAGPEIHPLMAMPDAAAPQANILPEPVPKVELQVRKFFPETWIWTIAPVGDDGALNLPVTVPDTITDWVTSGFCLADVGFGMSPSVTLRVFKPFFVEPVLPYSVVRGEIFKLKATVYNYLKDCIKILTKLEKSEEFKLEARPEEEYTSCLCADEGKTFYWDVTPLKLGEVNLTITTEALDSKEVCGNEITVTPTEGRIDKLIKPILVKPGGILEEKAHSSLICAEGDGEASDTVSLKVPENILPDSGRAHILILGDIMGTALSNIDQLLAMPYGCGEQNMVKFAPNIYILDYLEKTGQMTGPIKEKAVEYLKSGYQRELNYKHDDGSYSAFGKSDESGNTWLTAFVMKSFSAAGRYIYINEDHIEESFRWLKKQQLDNGCFRSVGKLFNNALMGGVDNDLSLSVYITIAMLERQLPHNDSTVERAVNCLKESLVNVTNIYTKAMMAYAFGIAGETEARAKVMVDLEKEAVRSGGQIHWERKDRPKLVDVPYWYQAPSDEVELTAYALLAYLSGAEVSKEDIGTASQCVSWLSKQQNPYGGYSSTQDTVVALQSIALYSKATYSEKGDVTVTVKSGAGFHQEFHVNNKNRLLLQQAPLADIPGEYTVSAVGKGCVYLQTTLRYNVPPPKSEATFKLAVTTEPATCTEAARTKFSISITASYTGDREASNMALIEVKMLSGFIPVKGSVREMEKSGSVKKVEIKPDQVTIYLDQLQKDTQQFNFSVEQDNEVKNLKPATATVYDYYMKDEHAMAEYNSPCSTEEESQPKNTE